MTSNKTIIGLKAAIFIFLFLISFKSAYAEIVHLKSGETIETAIVGQSEEHIKIYYYDSILTYYKDEIEKIEPQVYPADEYPSLNPEQDADLIYQIRDKYYAPGEQGLRGFSCQFRSSIIEKVADRVNLEVSVDQGQAYNFDDLELFVTFGTPDKIEIETQPAGFLSAIEQLDSIDQRVSGALRHTRWAARGFAQGWSFFMLSTTAQLMGRDHRIVKTAEGYMISYGGLKAFVDKNLSFTKIIFRQGPAKTVYFPEFVNSDKGLLFSGYFLSLNEGNDYLNVRGMVEYTTVDGFFLPQKLNIQEAGGDQTLKLNFMNYKLDLSR